MSDNDRTYFYERAEQELAMAQQAAGPESSRAHYELAGHYLDLAYGGDQGTPPTVDQVRAQLPRRH